VTKNPPQCNHCCSHFPGRANYQNNILIPIIERNFPNGAKAWHLVAVAHKAESDKHELHTEEDLHNNWVRKLCNSFKKPTDSTGDITDRIHLVLRMKGAFSASQTQAFLVPRQPKKAPNHISYKMKLPGDSPIITTTPKMKSMSNL
jgi:hypothetical protein